MRHHNTLPKNKRTIHGWSIEKEIFTIDYLTLSQVYKLSFNLGTKTPLIVTPKKTPSIKRHLHECMFRKKCYDDNYEYSQTIAS